MTYNEARQKIVQLQEEMSYEELCNGPLKDVLDLQYAWDYHFGITDNKGNRLRDMVPEYNSDTTGFSVRSMSAYRSGRLQLEFNPFDLRENHEWKLLLHPWEDKYFCIRNLTVGIQKLARRFKLQDSLLSLRDIDSPFSLAKDCYMEIIGLTDALIEADDFIVGLYKYSQVNHLTMCYLLNGADELKQHFELVFGSFRLLCESFGAEFVQSTLEWTEQRNHNLTAFRTIAHSSSLLGLKDDEIAAITDRAKSRPEERNLANSVSDALNCTLTESSLSNGFDSVRNCNGPREAELVMRLAQAMAPELLMNLLSRIHAFCNNLNLLKEVAEKLQETPERYDDAFCELIDCYKNSESYQADYRNFILEPAAHAYRKEVKELEQAEIDKFFVTRYKKHIITENEVYAQCGQLMQIHGGSWTEVLEVIGDIGRQEEQFRMYMLFMAYDMTKIEEFVGSVMKGDTADATPSKTKKKQGAPPSPSLSEIAMEPDKEQHIRRFIECIRGKKGRQAATLAEAATKLKWFSTHPAFSTLKKEAGVVGTAEGYNKYIRGNLPLKDHELEAGKQQLLSIHT